MSKKLEDNGLWESSRMMLPEHKSELIRFNIEENRRMRIQLADDELELIGRAMMESMHLRKPITLRMYDEYEELKVEGIVDKVAELTGRFMVDGVWFYIQDIEGVLNEESEEYSN